MSWPARLNLQSPAPDWHASGNPPCQLLELTRRRMKGARVWVAPGEGLGLPTTLPALPLLPTEVAGPTECETCSCRPLPPTGAALLLPAPPALLLPAPPALLLLVRQLLGCHDFGSMLLTPPLQQQSQ